MKKKMMYFSVTCMIIGTCFGCGKSGQSETESNTTNNTETTVMAETNVETDENIKMQSEQIETAGEDSWEDSADGWD